MFHFCEENFTSKKEIKDHLYFYKSQYHLTKLFVGCVMLPICSRFRKVALYCAWNTDNGGPQSAASAAHLLQQMRAHYPNATVHASTFEEFSDAAAAVMDQLPVVTSEIGDTWLYGARIAAVLWSSEFCLFLVLLFGWRNFHACGADFA